MSYEEQRHEPIRRPRGRHALPRAAAPEAAPTAAGSRRAHRARRAGRSSVGAPAAASVARHTSAVAAWLFDRRVHVMIFTASVAIVVMGGTLALSPFADAARPGRDVATVADTDRPKPTDRAASSSAAPVVASPAPSPSTGPASPTPQPSEAPVAPLPEAPVEPPAEPAPAEPPQPDTAPAPTTPAENPSTPAPTDCEQGGLLGALFGPPCP